jgi:predicted metal-dependent phosphoesterase TrpH
VLRADFHHHIDADPLDGKFVHHSAGALIDHAAAVGLHVLAITCHESVPYDGDAARYAAGRGVLLLRGMEATVEGHHVLLLNFPEFPPGVCGMGEIAARKTRDAVVIAPHPFYPVGMGMGDTLAKYPGIFDAVEFSGMYTPLTRRFNRRAADYARHAGMSVVGNSDTHFLWQLGHTYTLIDAPAEPAAVIQALRNGRTRVVTRPLSWLHVVRFIVASGGTVDSLRDSFKYLRRVLRRTRTARRRFDEPAALM